ncbi:MAG: hypothetical protein K0R18_594 [Bacillales bacterium]|jgi:transcriptional regulator of NAD metabolism|nr:hypothetical protein [Bacillales bacterium]
MMNNFIKSIFDGYGAAKEPERKEWTFQELESYPMLFSSKYLNECYNQATKKSEYESILDHLYRFADVTHDVPSYQKIEQKIIDKYRRD